VRSAAFLVALALGQAPGGGAATDLPKDVQATGASGLDAHLSVTPRTEEEAARVGKVTAPATAFDAPEPFEANPGGAATSRRRPDANAFSHPSATLDFAQELDFKVGNGVFKKLWVSAPASTLASDGLGPLYNARSCQTCHLKDGRGHPPAPGEHPTQMFLRLSVPAEAPENAPVGWIATAPEPVYGAQFQTSSVQGHPAEGRLAIAYEERVIALAGGETATLRMPTYSVEGLAYGPMQADVMTSPRVTPQVIGLGLAEAIPVADILALADPDDEDGDGISGRANMIWSDEFEREMLGRFGHKAGEPTIRDQTAGAFANDIGISSSVQPHPWGDCTAQQAGCRDAPHGGDPEIEDVALDLVTFYTRNLAVPARRDMDDPDVLRGKAVFHDLGCPACHAPKFVTHRMPDRPEHSFQLIWPYSDFLLHDMGPDLADGRPEGLATGREWRTAPLWGIGLTETVTGRASFLHDGRARALLEAVLGHGGEAEAARDGAAALDPSDRAALIRFLESL
jgi:CxxC motif-containing protein (DUF1111 family)